MYQGNVQAAVDQANLLSGVRNDIESVVLSCQSRVGVLKYLNSCPVHTSRLPQSLYSRSVAGLTVRTRWSMPR